MEIEWKETQATMSEKIMCQVYASSRWEEMYLYVERDNDLSSLPAELWERFGTPRPVLVVLLTESRTLARVNVRDVMESIQGKGFYLQMPPNPDFSIHAVR